MFVDCTNCDWQAGDHWANIWSAAMMHHLNTGHNLRAGGDPVTAVNPYRDAGEAIRAIRAGRYAAQNVARFLPDNSGLLGYARKLIDHLAAAEALAESLEWALAAKYERVQS